jgi:GntR family transcriptional regulator
VINLGVKSIHIILDFRSGIPIYTQVMDHIRQMVASGELQKGDQLPTVRQLATDLRVNFNTIARAYRMLDEAGLISTQHGRGTYIWESPSEETLQRLRKEGLLGLTQRYLQEASHMGATADEIWSTFEDQYRSWKAGSTPKMPDKP